MIRIGIDTGGTFTDLVRLGPDGLAVHKVASSPDDPSRAIVEGLEALCPEGVDSEIVHGSTVATNAVLERKGARVALVATAGFEDVLRIGRQTRRELYNFFVQDRSPLVESGLTFGLVERVDAGGAVLTPLDEKAIAVLERQIASVKPEAVAVCLLHSYRNPSHERAVESHLHGKGYVVSASHRILPEYREFERWSTTVANAYVTPVMARYLSALERRLRERRLRVMQSNGGSMSTAAAAAGAVRTILSGPAAGVVGAHAVARAGGHRRVIGFDMGGTSTDVSLIDGAIGVTAEAVIGDVPVRLPMIDIHTVGAGGGSIAYVDEGGALRVGPRSAGADPGPVCYGKGEELTVTDANLLLGRLDPTRFLGGRMSLDVARSRLVARRLARQAGLTETALAAGIVRVANANMERAIRVVSVQRGYDPRDFALLAFGGAGGMHACEIADALEIATVIVPRHAGVLSALGMLFADVTRDYSATVLRPAADVRTSDLRRWFRPLQQQARRELRAEGFTLSQTLLECALDLRYMGQSYELTVPYRGDFRAEFDRRHERRYGYANRQRPVEIVTLRVKAIGVTRKPELPRARASRVRPRPVEIRRSWFNGRLVPTPFYRREDLVPGSFGGGPAVITGAEATSVISPGFRFQVDRFGNIVATRP